MKLRLKKRVGLWGILGGTLRDNLDDRLDSNLQDTLSIILDEALWDNGPGIGMEDSLQESFLGSITESCRRSG